MGNRSAQENGAVEVSATISPDVFASVLPLLGDGSARVQVNFNLSGRPPSAWDGEEPLYGRRRFFCDRQLGRRY